MRMGFIRENHGNSAEALRAQITTLAVAGIVLCTGRLLCRGRVRYIPVVAVMGSVSGMGIAGLDHHGQGRQRGRPSQRYR